jgi:hypothetical protein
VSATPIVYNEYTSNYYRKVMPMEARTTIQNRIARYEIELQMVWGILDANRNAENTEGVKYWTERRDEVIAKLSALREILQEI